MLSLDSETRMAVSSEARLMDWWQKIGDIETTVRRVREAEELERQLRPPTAE